MGLECGWWDSRFEFYFILVNLNLNWQSYLPIAHDSISLDYIGNYIRLYKQSLKNAAPLPWQRNHSLPFIWICEVFQLLLARDSLNRGFSHQSTLYTAHFLNLIHEIPCPCYSGVNRQESHWLSLSLHCFNPPFPLCAPHTSKASALPLSCAPCLEFNSRVKQHFILCFKVSISPSLVERLALQTKKGQKKQKQKRQKHWALQSLPCKDGKMTACYYTTSGHVFMWG